VSEPVRDEDVRDWALALGPPGLIDIHTHFLPPPMMRRVWAHFCDGSPLIGSRMAGGVHVAGPGTGRTPAAHGRAHFSALAYAHRPAMSADLNDWTL